MKIDVLRALGLVALEVDASLVSELQETIQATKGLSEEASATMADLAAMSASEWSLLMQAPNDESLLPIYVRWDTLGLSALKTDTLPTLTCRTWDRIESNNLRLDDLFLFTSDVQKYSEQPHVDHTSWLESLQEDYGNQMDIFIDNVSNTPMGEALGMTSDRGQAMLRVEAILWRSRLDVLLGEEDEASVERLVELMQRWDIQGGGGYDATGQPLNPFISPSPLTRRPPTTGPLTT